MAENFIRRHWAQCSACGYATGHASTGSFISHFFLPTLCPNCGENIGLRQNGTHWLYVSETRKRIPPVRTRNPLTWLRSAEWVVVASDEFEARF